VTADESRAGARDVYLPAHDRAMGHRSYPSPDLKSVLVVEMDAGGGFGPCRLVPFDGNSPARPIGPPEGSCHFAAWSPDGKWMYFSSNSGGAFHTWRQRFPDGQPEQITSGPTEEEGIAIAPDGRSFVTAVGVRQSSIWVHDGRGDRQISIEGRAFQPRFTPDGKTLLYRVRTPHGSELWVANLDSSHAEPLLPGFSLPVAADFVMSWYLGYDISLDGRQVVFCSPGAGGKRRLWIAPLDRRSPPRQIPDVEGEQPVFGANGEIFFRKLEGTSAFLYSVRPDGTGLRKAADFVVMGLFGTDPEHKWVLTGAAPGGETMVPVTGGAPIFTHAHPPVRFGWTGDGKHLFVVATNDRRSRAFVLPLSPGQVFPAALANTDALPSEAELAKLPGVRTIPISDVVPGPTADIYAFTRESVQRNLYRIPLP
jgi:dipeptidyl aminopeptidase/acylaminoacyl peptidase